MARKKKRPKPHCLADLASSEMANREAFLILEPRIAAIVTGCDILHFLINNSDAANREDQICWIVDKMKVDITDLQIGFTK